MVIPRENLREGQPLDASEFAVHLDHIRDGDARPDYQDPVRFWNNPANQTLHQTPESPAALAEAGGGAGELIVRRAAPKLIGEI